jgi:hypothetical protein
MGLLGAIAGYITLALTSTLVQEIWLGGVLTQRVRWTAMGSKRELRPL